MSTLLEVIKVLSGLAMAGLTVAWVVILRTDATILEALDDRLSVAVFVSWILTTLLYLLMHCLCLGIRLRTSAARAQQRPAVAPTQTHTHTLSYGAFLLNLVFSAMVITFTLINISGQPITPLLIAKSGVPGISVAAWLNSIRTNADRPFQAELNVAGN